MDQKTINYYSENAQTVAARYESVVSSLSESFEDAFRARSKLLDIGCGSGRDLALLATMGHDCFGVDATPEFGGCTEFCVNGAGISPWASCLRTEW